MYIYIHMLYLYVVTGMNKSLFVDLLLVFVKYLFRDKLIVVQMKWTFECRSNTINVAALKEKFSAGSVGHSLAIVYNINHAWKNI